MKRERRAWTAQEVDTAQRLKAMGLTWGQVAERLGRTRNGVTAYMSYLRSGAIRHPGRRPEWDRRREWIALAEQGWTTGEIGRAYGISSAHVCARLSAHGYDREVRLGFMKERHDPSHAHPAA